MVNASTAFLLVQFPLAFGGLLTAAFYPTQGSATVLLDPGGKTAAPAIEWAREHEAPLLGLNADGSAPVVRMSGTASVLAALEAGYIPLAADLASCGTPPRNKGFRK